MARITIELDYDPTNPDHQRHEDEWRDVDLWLNRELAARFNLKVREVMFYVFD